MRRWTVVEDGGRREEPRERRRANRAKLRLHPAAERGRHRGSAVVVVRGAGGDFKEEGPRRRRLRGRASLHHGEREPRCGCAG